MAVFGTQNPQKYYGLALQDIHTYIHTYERTYININKQTKIKKKHKKNAGHRRL